MPSPPKDDAPDAVHMETHEDTPSDPDPDSGPRNKAAEVLKQAEAEHHREEGGSVAVTPEDNARVLRLIDMRILPILLVVYCLQSLDKTTLSYASVFGIIEDTGLVGDQFSWLGSVVYVAQLVFQPAVAYVLVRFPVGKFAATMVFCWGSILCCMAASHNFAGLMVTRLLLGVFEASVAPTFIAVVQMWYRRREQTKRNAAWYAMLGVVNILGSLLSFGLGHIKSPLRPYQVIFLFCGAITVAFSFVMYIWMPDSPVKAKFLGVQDKAVAIERLRMNQMGMETGEWRWSHVWDAARDLKTWLWFAIMFVVSIPSGGISAFGPLIIESFGFGDFTTILFNMPFGAVQMVSTLGGAWLADRLRMKSPVLLLLCLPPVAGCAILLAVGRGAGDRAVLLVGYYLISVYPGISPLVYSWSGQNTAGDTKRKVTTAVIFVGASAGNIVGPLLFRPAEAPRYTRGLTANLVLFVLLAILVMLGMLLIRVLNARQASKRRAMGKPEHVVDLSMADQKQLDQSGDADGVALENGLDDLTDRQNEDFVYVY